MATQVSCPDCNTEGTQQWTMRYMNGTNQRRTRQCSTCRGAGSIGIRKAANLTTKRAEYAAYRLAWQEWANITHLGTSYYDMWLRAGQPDPLTYAREINERVYGGRLKVG